MRRKNPAKNFGFIVLNDLNNKIAEELVVTEAYSTAREQVIQKLGNRGILITGFGKITETPYLTTQVLKGRVLKAAGAAPTPSPTVAPRPAPAPAPKPESKPTVPSPVDYMAPPAPKPVPVAPKPAAPGVATVSTGFVQIYDGMLRMKVAGAPREFHELLFRHSSGIVVQLLENTSAYDDEAHALTRAIGYGVSVNEQFMPYASGPFPQNYQRIEALWTWNWQGSNKPMLSREELLAKVAGMITALLATPASGVELLDDPIVTGARGV